MKLVFLVISTLVGSFSIVGGKPTGKQLAPWEADASVDVFPANKRQTNETEDATKSKTVYGPEADTPADNTRLIRWEESSDNYSLPLVSDNWPGFTKEDEAMRRLYSQGGDLFEGDIQLTEEQKNGFSALNAVPNLWPRGNNGLVRIAYEVSDVFSKEEKQKILNPIRDINSWFSGCLELFSCAGCKTDIIYIKPGSGCSSSVGRIGGWQALRLADGCVYWSTIVHEFFHALGLRHEQNRKDRDNFVRVFLDNIKPNHTHNFNNNHNTNAHGVGYNPYSIMHYGPYNFAKQGKMSMDWAGENEKFCKKHGCVPMGTFIWPRSIKYDVLKLKRAYGCPA